MFVGQIGHYKIILLGGMVVSMVKWGMKRKIAFLLVLTVAVLLVAKVNSLPVGSLNLKSPDSCVKIGGVLLSDDSDPDSQGKEDIGPIQGGLGAQSLFGRTENKQDDVKKVPLTQDSDEGSMPGSESKLTSGFDGTTLSDLEVLLVPTSDNKSLCSDLEDLMTPSSSEGSVESNFEEPTTPEPERPETPVLEMRISADKTVTPEQSLSIFSRGISYRTVVEDHKVEDGLVAGSKFIRPVAVFPWSTLLDCLDDIT